MKIALYASAIMLAIPGTAIAQNADVAASADQPGIAKARPDMAERPDTEARRIAHARKKQARIKAARKKQARIKKARLKHKRIKNHRIKMARRKAAAR